MTYLDFLADLLPASVFVVSIILTVAMVSLRLMGQPASRIFVTRLTLIACLAAPLLCCLPVIPRLGLVGGSERAAESLAKKEFVPVEHKGTKNTEKLLSI